MNKFKLYLTNTLSGNVELFSLYNSKENNTNFNEKCKTIKKIDVTLYVCGITPYDYAHLGHGRCYVTFDLLYRLLNFLNYNVKYCRNFTDIDDKIINKAEKELSDQNRYLEISNKFINAYKEDMERLNCLTPKYQPKVTENIPEIIEFIKVLIEKNYAYKSSSGVYYSVESFKNYGQLSKRNLKELKAGARIEVREDKKCPLDFALWKYTDVKNPGWESPWGYGRPGWHIECSTLIKKYLADSITIHGGGMDLIFPHHENEIAQSQAALSVELSKYWVHNAFILLDKEKMSKSLGNFFTLREVFKKFDPILLRYYFLNHHYRSPLEFSFQDLEVASKSYQKLVNFFENVEDKNLKDIQANSDLSKELLNAILSDLNTTKFFGLIFQNIKDFDKDSAIFAKALIKNILGLNLENILKEKKEIEITPEIQNLIDQRNKAREEKDWKKADKIRDELKNLGFEVQDKKLS